MSTENEEWRENSFNEENTGAGQKFVIIGPEAAAQPHYLAMGQRARPPEFAPQGQDYLVDILVVHVVDNIVERLILFHGDVGISQRNGRFGMVFGVYVEQHLENGGGHLPVSGQKK